MKKIYLIYIPLIILAVLLISLYFVNVKSPNKLINEEIQLGIE